MEQMYLVEIFIDKVTVFTTEDDDSSASKNLIVKVRFGPKTQFIIKEAQLALNDDKKDDIIETDTDTGRRKWTRIVRVGKSYLFPSYPDTLLQTLANFPLEIEVWNDDDKEVEIYVGVGQMHWDTQFFYMLKETTDGCKLHEPLTIKSKTTLYKECCCSQAGEIQFILRLSALGGSITTEFQQLLKDPDYFVFRTDKAPSMFQCKRIEGDDPNFTMVGSLFETATLEDPDVGQAQRKIEVCTELQSCGAASDGTRYVCDHSQDSSELNKKKYAITKIRMGDITGPCGNQNCVLANKIKTYIRNLESYKGKAAAAGISQEGKPNARKVCGQCYCKDDRWHREECTDADGKLPKEKARCEGCGGYSKKGDTCEDRKQKLFGTGATPKPSDAQVNYVLSVPKFPGYKKSPFQQDYIVEDCYSCSRCDYSYDSSNICSQGGCQSACGCQCSSGNCQKSGTSKSDQKTENKASVHSKGVHPMVFNVETRTSKGYSTGLSRASVCPVNAGTGTSDAKDSRNVQIYNCMEISDEKDCRCSPIKPSPPCKTFDCECIAEIANINSRKLHRPYCPSYKHKSNCPVTMMHEEDELTKKGEDDDDEVAPLPYGLPPVQLGPCPVMGRPCSVPDGFARMYKNALQPTLPASFSNAGKVCCSKEFERIKKAMKEYLKYEKAHDYRCVNKFDVDTERRCCDKEQLLLCLMGKGCCGSHKMAIQEKYKDEKKPKNQS